MDSPYCQKRATGKGKSTVQAVHNITRFRKNKPKRSCANSYELFRRFPNSQIN